MTENQEVHFQDVAFDPKLNRGSSEKELLKSFPEEDIEDVRGFLSGFQIKKIRTEERELPEWVRTNEGIQRVLLAAFPHLQTSENQRKRAGIWARILYLYHRLGWPSSEIAKELGYKTRAPIDMAIMRIGRVAAGLTVHGTARKN